MNNTPKALRLQIALFGRTNTGKSSFLNMVANQDVALTSPITFLDTAGIDDTSMLSDIRIERTMKIVDRAEIFVIIAEPNIWTDFEENISDIAKKSEIPLIIVVNKIDIEEPTYNYLLQLRTKTNNIIRSSFFISPILF